MMSTLQLLCINLFLLLTVSAQAATIQVAVDRNPVNLNDSFQITFTADQEPDAEPDFSPLEQNFEILNQQRSSNSSWVNGHGSRSEQWILNVMAKQAGEILIPPIAFGSDSSKPLNISVRENAGTPQSNEDLILEVTATPEKPYVQAQVLYTVRLYRRVQVAQARLDEPQLKDAVVEKLGEDSTYSTQLQGVDYWVTERKYAIFPQQSGVLTIAPLTLNAEVVTQQRSRFNGFFNQPSTEVRRISSKAITLNVQAVPAGFKGNTWLTAESVQLSEEWSDNSLQTRVGEPLTRTVKLSARGATVGQLPELSSVSNMDGIKTYPDQPVLKEDKQSDSLTATREEKVAFIPSKPGEYTLPALEITWFNTKTQKLETAKLPGVTIHASASNDASPAQAVNIPNENPTATPIITTQVTNNTDIRIWQGLSAFLATGWLLTLTGFYLRKRKKIAPVSPVKKSAGQLSESTLEKNLKRACWENNPQTVKQLLLQWGKTQLGVENLDSMAKICGQPLSGEISKLNQQLYSKQAQSWNGESLWQAFSNHSLEQKLASVQDDGLEPLFKL